MIDGLKELSYEERLKSLSLPTLQERARMNDLVQTYRIMNNIDSMGERMFKKVTQAHSRCTRNSSKENIVLHKSNLEVRRHYLTQRVVSDWNSLPEEVQQARNLELFKEGLNTLPLKSA